MNPEQLQMLVRWLTEQIENANHTIEESQQSRNFGRLAVYEGMRDAYAKCLDRVMAKKPR